jgi:hypothetical protein
VQRQLNIRKYCCRWRLHGLLSSCPSTGVPPLGWSNTQCKGLGPAWDGVWITCTCTMQLLYVVLPSHRQASGRQHQADKVLDQELDPTHAGVIVIRRSKLIQLTLSCISGWVRVRFPGLAL